MTTGSPEFSEIGRIPDEEWKRKVHVRRVENLVSFLDSLKLDLSPETIKNRAENFLNYPDVQQWLTSHNAELFSQTSAHSVFLYTNLLSETWCNDILGPEDYDAILANDILLNCLYGVLVNPFVYFGYLEFLRGEHRKQKKIKTAFSKDGINQIKEIYEILVRSTTYSCGEDEFVCMYQQLCLDFFSEIIEVLGKQDLIKHVQRDVFNDSSKTNIQRVADWIELTGERLGSLDPQNRVWIMSFLAKWDFLHNFDEHLQFALDQIAKKFGTADDLASRINLHAEIFMTEMISRFHSPK